jgi:transcriptional antiterminator RfaH
LNEGVYVAEQNDSGGLWYLAQSKPNRQSIAELHLARQGFEVFAPQHRESLQTRTGREWVRRPLFPGYLFVKADPAQGAWRAIRGTLGISRLVQFGKDEPVRVPEDLITGLMHRCDTLGDDLSDPLQPGDRVRMLGGPFMDFLATVQKISPGQRVWVLLDFMGRQARAFVWRSEISTA